MLQPGQFVLTANGGAYLVTGTASGLLAARRLDLVAGSYVTTGFAAYATHGHTVIASPGAYVLAGQQALLELARQIRLEPGSYLISGAQAELLYGALQTVADGWQFTDESLVSPGFAGEASGNSGVSDEGLDVSNLEEEMLV
jgi:hypothetical protein